MICGYTDYLFPLPESESINLCYHWYCIPCITTIRIVTFAPTISKNQAKNPVLRLELCIIVTLKI